MLVLLCFCTLCKFEFMWGLFIYDPWKSGFWCLWIEFFCFDIEVSFFRGPTSNPSFWAICRYNLPTEGISAWISTTWHRAFLQWAVMIGQSLLAFWFLGGSWKRGKFDLFLVPPFYRIGPNYFLNNPSFKILVPLKSMISKPVSFLISLRAVLLLV